MNYNRFLEKAFHIFIVCNMFIWNRFSRSTIIEVVSIFKRLIMLTIKSIFLCECLHVVEFSCLLEIQPSTYTINVL